MSIATLVTASTGATLQSCLSADIVNLTAGAAVDSCAVVTDSPGLMMIKGANGWQQYPLSNNGLEDAPSRVALLFLNGVMASATYAVQAAVSNTFTLAMKYRNDASFILKFPFDIAQVETATVGAGTVTADPGGSATVTITSAGMAGSPLAISVPLLLGDVTNVIATKIRAALTANSVVNTRFAVSGATSAVILTRRVPATADATLNIAIAPGTATSVTTVASSANTVTGDTKGAAKTIAITEAPTDCVVKLELVYTTAVVITWPTGITWPTSSAPTWVAGRTYMVKLVTADSGATWFGSVEGIAIA